LEAISPERGWGDWLQHDVDHIMCLALRLRIGGAIPLLPPPGLHFMDRYNFTITACFVVNCVRSLMPNVYGVLPKILLLCPALFQTTGQQANTVKFRLYIPEGAN